jgi:hypothetical protein
MLLMEVALLLQEKIILLEFMMSKQKKLPKILRASHGKKQAIITDYFL